MNLTDLLDETASHWPQKAALIEGENPISYADLVALTQTLASRLQPFLPSPGSRVGLHFPNGVPFVALTFALWRIPATVVPLPMECTAEELAQIATTMQLDGWLTATPRPGSTLLAENVYFTPLHPPIRADNHGLNLAFIRFTSGTTSARKGVALCHDTVHARLLAANQALQISPRDTIIWCLPMAHHFLVTIVLYLSQGATIVLARHLLSLPFLTAVNRWQGTILYAAPFHYSMLAGDLSGLPLPQVRLAVSTTCGLTRELAGDFQRRFGIPLVQALGAIELGLVCVNVSDPVLRWDSVGRPLPSFAVRIHEPDPEGYGEVMFTGPGLLDAYTHPWLSREELMPDGWFATGDLGRLDAEGYLFLAGRKSAVINLAGRKVFPEEIEAVLNRHPAVRESRVSGTTHPHLGEVVEAEVVLRGPSGTEDLREFCRRHLSADKIPNAFHVVKIIPKTAVTGKICRPQVTPAK